MKLSPGGGGSGHRVVSVLFVMGHADGQSQVLDSVLAHGAKTVQSLKEYPLRETPNIGIE